MNRQKWILGVIVILMIGGSAVSMMRIKSSQRLGAPGLETSSVAGSHRLRVELPEKVTGFESEWIEMDDLTKQALPQDTSFGQRHYTAADDFKAQATVVLMGGDRSSLHKPQFCLSGQGWVIDESASLETNLPIGGPAPYKLPIVKLVAAKEANIGGQMVKLRGVYVYWYVADGVVSASTSGIQRMWWMARDLVRTGVLQRWAYVSYFSVCTPGQEEATFERLKTLIIESVPQFQHPPNPMVASAH